MDRAVRKNIVIFLTFIPAIFYAQNAQELFLRGNKAHEQKQWNDALSLYNTIEKKGRAVWYNMGNCFYRLGKFSQAIVCWKRAACGASLIEYDDSMMNIAAAYEKLGNPKEDSLFIAFERWANVLPTLPLQVLFLLCWYALWIIGMVGYRRRILFYSVMFGLSFLVIILGNILLTKYYAQKYEKGIVVNNTSQLLAGPHEGYHTIGNVPLADELLVYEKRPGWYKVAGHNAQGWIPSSNVEVI